MERKVETPSRPARSAGRFVSCKQELDGLARQARPYGEPLGSLKRHSLGNAHRHCQSAGLSWEEGARADHCQTRINECLMRRAYNGHGTRHDRPGRIKNELDTHLTAAALPTVGARWRPARTRRGFTSTSSERFASAKSAGT